MSIAIAIIVTAVLLFFVYASYSIGFGYYVKSICTMESNEKVVAITFDDGPCNHTTPKVLEVLTRHNIEAAFFLIGKNFEQNFEIARQIEKEGHLIGIHSYGHESAFPFYSKARMVGEMNKCISLLGQLGSRYNKIYFRPPFGVTNPNIASAIKETGAVSVGWNIRSMDTTLDLGKQGERKKCIDKIMKRLAPGSIILLHDRLEHSHTLLEELITSIHSAGYKIIRFDKATENGNN